MKKWLIQAIGIIAGAGLGFAYYAFVGCKTGTCPLQSNPFFSMLLGGMIGWSLSDLIVDRIAKHQAK